MEIVINKCWGGFGLSIEAVKELHKLKDPHVKCITKDEYFGNSTAWRTGEQRLQHLRTCNIPILEDGTILLEEHRYEDRDCKLLVKVVKKLGTMANGQNAELEIVKVPNGVKYEIDEYDGVESIHEKHRSWR